MYYDFEWDLQKAGINRRKHGVSFEEAATVFRDQNALTIADTEHGKDEERWITLGLSASGRLLVVCHTFRETARSQRCTLRIFSSRKAAKHESKQYRGDT